jgi:hypothetical protein
MAIAGKVAITPKGNYQAGEAYYKLDFVQYNGNTYVCKKDCKDIEPTDTDYWMESCKGVTLQGDTKDNTATFDIADERINIISGESHADIFGKIERFFNDLKTLAFTADYNDLDNTPDLSDLDGENIENAFNNVYTTTTEGDVES